MTMLSGTLRKQRDQAGDGEPARHYGGGGGQKRWAMPEETQPDGKRNMRDVQREVSVQKRVVIGGAKATVQHI